MRVLSRVAICAFLLTSSSEAIPRSEVQASDGAVPDSPATTRGSTQGLQWIPVHGAGQSPCETYAESSSPTDEEVWCFEGAGGDSTWPAQPSSGGFQHWSLFDPPGGALSKWHVTSELGGPSTGSFNAWCGCDSVGTNPGCSDVSFWVFQQGYGDDWNYALTLDLSGGDASAGGTIEFDLRYDTECNYDYAYLEYLTPLGDWEAVLDSSGAAAVFNSISGNPDNQSGGTGEPCGGDIYGASGERDLGGGNEPFYGNSAWLTDVTFPLPAQAGGVQLRWRGFSDPAWSDADGRGDTDGLIAVDNVEVTLAATGTVVTDDFETGDFLGLQTAGPALSSPATWTPGSLIGNTYDGWHLEFDPNYKNKGNTCSFSDSWMWAAKPAGMAIPENGFHYLLATPAIDVSGWTGAVIRYERYICIPENRNDWLQEEARTYTPGIGWSSWERIAEGIIFPPIFGCVGPVIATDDVSRFLDTNTDSLQIAWTVRDFSQPGEATWGKHGAVQYLVDDVAIASYDATIPVLSSGTFDRFRDTFSRADPAHSTNLSNSEEGLWPGRAFDVGEGLEVRVQDEEGVSAGNVLVHWRVGTGQPPTFGTWSNKAMALTGSFPSNTTYWEVAIGDDASEDWSGVAGDGHIWEAGTTVEYYVTAMDDVGNIGRLPINGAYDFSVLPFANTSPAQGNATILLFGEQTDQTLDFENSGGFEPAGGTGEGGVRKPVFVEETDYVVDVLTALGLEFDRFDGGLVDPRGAPIPAAGVGGFLDEFGQPTYDLMIWSHEDFSFDLTFELETIPDLEAYLDAGGHLLVLHDRAAFEIGVFADPVEVPFLEEYLGLAADPLGDLTEAAVLQLVGEVGTAHEARELSLYGACPDGRTYQRLVLSSPVGGTSSALYRFGGGAGSDNGRIAVARSQRSVGGGIAVTAPSLGSHASRYGAACMLSEVLTSEFGITVPSPSGCVPTDVTLPPATTHALALSPPRPSPFLESTTLQFSLPAAGIARVALFDVTGRQVRSLANRRFAPGEHTLTWDGRDGSGTPVAAGVYFVQMESGSSRLTQKVVRLP